MSHAGQRPRFAPKPLPGFFPYNRFVYGLNRDRPFEAIIPSLVYDAHATLADLSPDLVMANNFQDSPLRRFRHDIAALSRQPGAFQWHRHMPDGKFLLHQIADRTHNAFALVHMQDRHPP